MSALPGRDNERALRQSHAILYLRENRVQFKVHSDLASRSGVSLGPSLDRGEDKRRPSVQQRKEVLFEDRDKAAPHLGV